MMLRLKMTVMDRLVAELGGIETAIVALQDQVNNFKLHIHISVVNFPGDKRFELWLVFK